MAYTWAEKKREFTLLGGTLAAIVMLYAGSLIGGSSDGDKAPGHSAGKYEQTWAKAYSETTCREFKTAMTSAQRWAMAADMLTGARNGDSIATMPEDSLVTTFESGLATACVVETMNMTEMGAGLYLTERARWKQ